MSETGWAYSDKVKEHFMNPKNVLMDEEGFQNDGKGVAGNIQCGDEMIFLIKVDKDKGIITDCKWKTFGCASAIASASVLSEIAKGMKLDDAYNLSAKDITRELGGLPDHKVHCSVLGDKALRAAINDYYRRNGMEDRVKREEERVVCACLDITDQDIENAILEGARTFYELQERTKVGTGCGECQEEITELLQTYREKHFHEL
jgi:nitrogen fixation NifU-like protein